MKNSQIKIAIFCALFSAMLYALYPPIAKSLIVNCPPIYLAAFLYLGTFGGLILFTPLTKANLKAKSIQKSDYKVLLFVIFTNIAASIFMNWGVQLTSAGNIALLGNFEVVATAVVALIFFHQKISKVLWAAIVLITLASCVLCSNDIRNLSLSLGSFLAVVATIFWGFENNFTQVLSQRNPIQVTMIKGLGVGIGSFILAVLFNEKIPNIKVIILALILGFFAYGISIVFYILAQRYIGAAKTSAYYAVAPFLSVLLSVLFLHEKMTSLFIFSLILMIIGSILLTKDALK